MSNRRDRIRNTYGWKVTGIPRGIVIGGTKDIGRDRPMKEPDGSARTTRGSSSTTAIGKEVVGGSNTTMIGIVTAIEITTAIVMTIVIEIVTKLEKGDGSNIDAGAFQLALAFERPSRVGLP